MNTLYVWYYVYVWYSHMFVFTRQAFDSQNLKTQRIAEHSELFRLLWNILWKSFTFSSSIQTKKKKITELLRARRVSSRVSVHWRTAAPYIVILPKYSPNGPWKLFTRKKSDCDHEWGEAFRAASCAILSRVGLLKMPSLFPYKDKLST